MPGLARQYGARENRFCARLLKLLCAQGRRSSNKSHQRVRHKQDYLVRFHGFPPTRGSIFEARRGITAYRGQLIIASSSSTPGGAEDADYAPQQRSCIATAAGRPIFLSYARRILFGRPATSSKFGDCAKEDCVLLPPVPSCHPAKCRKDRACRPPAWEPERSCSLCHPASVEHSSSRSESIARKQARRPRISSIGLCQSEEICVLGSSRHSLTGIPHRTSDGHRRHQELKRRPRSASR